MAADLVLPSLDAGDEEMFQYVNRPHKDISFERMITGLIDFVRVYRGAVWLEVFLLAGVTAIPSEIAKIDALLRKIRPERVQLNTVTRPPAEEFACAVSEEQMEGLKELFSQTVEIIGRTLSCRMPGFADRAINGRYPCPAQKAALHRSKAFPPVWPCSPRRR